MPIIINPDKCTGCETCLDSCPFDAIELKDGKAYINEYCNACAACLSVCSEGAIISTESGVQTKERKQLIEDYKDVLVFAEQREGKVAPVSYELLGAGRRLADELGTGLLAALLGADESEAMELVKWGADKVLLCSDPVLEKFNDDVYSEVLAKIINEYKPSIVLAGATPIGRSFIPRVAARLRTGLTADCTSLEIDKDTKNLLQIRPAFGGNIMATISCPDYRPQMATVRPRVMKRGEYNANRTGEIINVDVDNLTPGTKVIESVKEVSEISVNLHEADIIVSGGRGVGGEKGVRMLEELAIALGGVVGASRAAIDEGWIPYSHQVGQTGKTVNPKVYIACGISGAVQHLVGMQSSDIIIAINKNPEAPIFNVATYGIVGDLFEIVPMLTKRIKEIKGT
ncbi:MAG: electron transfer flavoprotein subunit alpha [Thermodesulfovibrionia bacterium]|nr:electron transfer flavoprotein subunit alpha [Thermodesulfovibrionia bacterium]